LTQINKRRHYYSEFLFHSATGLRELTFDTLKVINTQNLPVNSYGAVDIPSDCQDVLSVSIPAGGGLSALPKQEWLNPLRVHSLTTGEFVSHNGSADDTDNNLFWFPGIWGTYYWNVSSYGEPTGRLFGAPGGTSIGYNVFPERRQIQMTRGFENGNVIVMYVSDGQSVDNATQIDIKAFQTIRAFQEWKRSENANNDNSPEGRSFYNQRRLLRARLNDMTRTDLLNILRNAYTAAIKS
jgi:hypothetical protein